MDAKYDKYYEAFVKYFRKNCDTYESIFEEARLIRKAIYEAEHHVASEKWYGEDK